MDAKQQAEQAPSDLPPGVDATTERDLVSAILRKDRKATARFVAAYADAVYGYVRHRLAPRADLVEDIVQDVFVAALAGLATFQASSSLRAWLLGIARHKVEDYYREQMRKPEAIDEHEDWDATAPDPPIEEMIDRERVETKTREVVRRLPETYAAALLWRYWEGRSVREIADASGKTEKAIERLLARARRRFRQLWEEITP